MDITPTENNAGIVFYVLIQVLEVIRASKIIINTFGSSDGSKKGILSGNLKT